MSGPSRRLPTTSLSTSSTKPRSIGRPAPPSIQGEPASFSNGSRSRTWRTSSAENETRGRGKVTTSVMGCPLLHVVRPEPAAHPSRRVDRDLVELLTDHGDHVAEQLAHERGGEQVERGGDGPVVQRE